MRDFNLLSVFWFFLFSCFRVHDDETAFFSCQNCKKYFQLDLMSSHEWEVSLETSTVSTLPRFINCIKFYVKVHGRSLCVNSCDDEFSSSIKEARYQISRPAWIQAMKAIRSTFLNEFETRNFSLFTRFSVCVWCVFCSKLLIFKPVFFLLFFSLSLSILPSIPSMLYSTASSTLELWSHKINFSSSWQKALVSPSSLSSLLFWRELERNVSPHPLKMNTTFRLI